MSKKALITGTTGQDGYHLADLLHEKGYEVYGVIRGRHNHSAYRFFVDNAEVALRIAQYWFLVPLRQ